MSPESLSRLAQVAVRAGEPKHLDVMLRSTRKNGCVSGLKGLRRTDCGLVELRVDPCLKAIDLTPNSQTC